MTTRKNDRRRSDRTPKKPEERGLVSQAPVTELWKPFPIEALPEPASGLVRAGSRALGCDPSYIALPLLAGLASSIGATRRIQLKPGWTEPSVLWVAIVGESGTLKSPALSLALEPLKKLQAWELQQYPELLQQYTRDIAIFEADMSAWKRVGRTKGEPPPEKPDEPSVRRYLVNDITIEALADRLQDAPRGLLVACDELGAWLGSFDQYRNGKGGDVSRWLSMHRAEGLLVDRKSGVKTVFVPRAALSMAGGIQPDIFRRALGEEHLANGLAARLLVAMPPRTAKSWTDASIARELSKDIERLFGRLLALDFATDEDDQPTPIDIPLSRDGKAAWISFYDAHAKEQNDLTGALGAAFSKLEGYAARLAMVDHLVRLTAGDSTVDPGEIGAQSIQSGATLVGWFGNEARRVYQTFSENDEDRDHRELLGLIDRKQGRITAREVQRAMTQYRGSAEDAEQALNRLVDAGLGSWSVEETGGRPVSVFSRSDPATCDTTPTKPEGNGASVTFVTRDTDEINRRLMEAVEAESDYLGGTA